MRETQHDREATTDQNQLRFQYSRLQYQLRFSLHSFPCYFQDDKGMATHDATHPEKGGTRRGWGDTCVRGESDRRSMIMSQKGCYEDN
jgi:hypothetical protein